MKLGQILVKDVFVNPSDVPKFLMVLFLGFTHKDTRIAKHELSSRWELYVTFQRNISHYSGGFLFFWFVSRIDKSVFLQYRQAVKSPPFALQQKQRSFLTFGFGAGPARRESHVNVNVTPTSHDLANDTPEIRKYKKKFNSEILCAALWGVKKFFKLVSMKSAIQLLKIQPTWIKFHIK